MATICKLCGEKLSFFDPGYSLLESTVCENCYNEYNKVFDSIPTALEFEENITKFQKKFPQSEYSEKAVEHLLKLHEDYIQDNPEEIKLKEEEEKRQKEEKQRREEDALRREVEIQKRIQEEHNRKMGVLTQMGLEGYYEYKVVSLLDESGIFRKKSGAVDTVAMTKTLNDLGLDGWHLVTAYSNELGKNALSGGVGGAMLGINSTVDENILIFERFVKISKG